MQRNEPCFTVCKNMSSGRGKRVVSHHVIDDVYSLAQGPIHLAGGKRERKKENAFAKNGK